MCKAIHIHPHKPIRQTGFYFRPRPPCLPIRRLGTRTRIFCEACYAPLTPVRPSKGAFRSSFRAPPGCVFGAVNCRGGSPLFKGASLPRRLWPFGSAESGVTVGGRTPLSLEVVEGTPLQGGTPPLGHMASPSPSPPPALRFEVVARFNRARSSRLTLPHFTAETPMFMPVGTQGTVKGLTSQQLEELDCHVILGNTYHLENRPGADLVAQMVRGGSGATLGPRGLPLSMHAWPAQPGLLASLPSSLTRAPAPSSPAGRPSPLHELAPRHAHRLGRLPDGVPAAPRRDQRGGGHLPVPGA